MENFDYKYFSLFHEAIMHHKAELSLHSLSKNPNKTLLLKDLVTINNIFNQSLFEFVYWLISDGNREIFVAKKCKLRFTHSQSNRNLMKILVYADSKCKLVEQEKDWAYKTMSIWKNKYEAIILKNVNAASNNQKTEKNTTDISERSRSLNRNDSFNSRSSSLTRNQDCNSNASSPSFRVRKEGRSANPSPNHRKTTSMNVNPSTPGQMKKFREMLELSCEEYENSAINYHSTASGTNTPNRSRSHTPSDFVKVKSMANLNAEEFELAAINYNCDSGSHRSQTSTIMRERRRKTPSPGHRRSRSISGKDFVSMFEGEDLTQDSCNTEVKKKLLSRKEKISEKFKDNSIADYSNYQNFTTEDDHAKYMAEAVSSPPVVPPNNSNKDSYINNNKDYDINNMSAADEYAKYIAESMMSPSIPEEPVPVVSRSASLGTIRSSKSENSSEAEFRKFETSIKTLANDLLATAISSDSPISIQESVGMNDQASVASSCIITTRKRNLFEELINKPDNENNNNGFKPISYETNSIFPDDVKQPLSNPATMTKSSEIATLLKSCKDEGGQREVLSSTRAMSPKLVNPVQSNNKSKFELLMNFNNDPEEEEEEKEYIADQRPSVSIESLTRKQSMIFDRSSSEEKEDMPSDQSVSKLKELIESEQQPPVSVPLQPEKVTTSVIIDPKQDRAASPMNLTKFNSWFNLTEDEQSEKGSVSSKSLGSICNKSIVSDNSNSMTIEKSRADGNVPNQFNGNIANKAFHSFQGNRINDDNRSALKPFEKTHSRSLSPTPLPVEPVIIPSVKVDVSVRLPLLDIYNYVNNHPNPNKADAFTITKLRTGVNNATQFKKMSIPILRQKSTIDLVNQLNLKKMFPRVQNSLITLQIVYENKYHVRSGNMISNNLITKKPFVSVSSPVKYNENAVIYHTLILSELDGRGLESIRWMMIQIPNNNISDGLQIIPYNLPLIEDSEMHRYIFSLYKQEQLLSNIEVSAIKSMFQSNIKYTSTEWIKDMQGKIINSPVAIEAFVSHNDIENQDSFGRSNYNSNIYHTNDILKSQYV